MSRTIVVIPTYNEKQNIEIVLERVLGAGPDIEVVVVDDNSPDGTADLVTRAAAGNPRLHLIRREGKQGLGTAYIAGFKYALKAGATLVMQMDADLSHDPRYIPDMLEAVRSHDLVIGSRYIKGVNVINWPMERLILSYMANVYTRVITAMPVHDATGGFKCFRREVLEAIELDEVISDGYCFQIEMNFRAWRRGFRIKEVPIVFVDRHSGTSKMSKRIIWEAIYKVWVLRFKGLMGRL
ncbi:MAG: polyprenol monophosphomannose synthase [bacterium]|jgi:dolichol-phosphate mannosyltransferase